MAKLVKPAFQADRNYKWEPSDSFTITGQEFAGLYHCLTQEMNISGGAPVALISQAFETIMNILKRGVEEGTITEADGTEAQLNQIDNNVRSMFNK